MTPHIDDLPAPQVDVPPLEQQQRTDGEARLEDAIGYRFRNPELLVRALSHRSWAFEAGGIADNERLEFLGDAVLGLVVTTEIFKRLPDEAEGRLAKVRAATVNTISLADVGRRIDLGAAVRLGVGEEQSGGRDKDSILANTTEAVIGAVYLDGGLEEARKVVMRLTEWLLTDMMTRRESLDYKTSLQELTASNLGTLPVYDLTDEGPDHAKTFTAVAVVDGLEMGTGTGRSKKEAEQAAAAEAFAALRSRLNDHEQDDEDHT